MSEGSRDQLYLALRLSALELQIQLGLNMPLITDDLFINFDDRRAAAGLHVLGGLSRKMQVIFLTHHDHLVPLAREALGGELNVVTLSGSPLCLRGRAGRFAAVNIIILVSI